MKSAAKRKEKDKNEAELTASESFTKYASAGCYYEGECAYRLPCGYCSMLGRQCPKLYSGGPVIVWQEPYYGTGTPNQYRMEITC